MGDFDHYELNLYNPNGSQKEAHFVKNLTEWCFRDLVPGRKYALVVVTHSGKLTNTANAEGRTGKELAFIFALLLPYMAFFYCLVTSALCETFYNDW